MRDEKVERRSFVYAFNPPPDAHHAHDAHSKRRSYPDDA